MTTITTLSAAATATLKLPDGRTVDRVPQGELYTTLGKLSVPGFAHTKGLAENLAAYSAHLQTIHDNAGREAVAAWLEGRKNV